MSTYRNIKRAKKKNTFVILGFCSRRSRSANAWEKYKQNAIKYEKNMKYNFNNSPETTATREWKYYLNTTLSGSDVNDF